MRSTLFLVAVAGLLAAFAGCSDDETDNPTTSSTSSSSGTGGSGGGGGLPALPALGSQIDRMGRPAINTAANATFTPDATRNAAENEYNQNSDPATWAAKHTANIAGSLAILDALDEVCGNQLLSCDDGAAGCYDALAGVLADDRLHIKANAATCTTYLAVEADAVMALPNEDCGGRKPDYDIIERSYSVLSGVGLAGFDDTIGPSAAAQVEVFPYLQTP